MDKKDVIIVTDGDDVAKKTIETATKNIGGRCISLSAGNPTLLSGNQIIELIEMAHHDPVVVMADDCGHKEEGYGELALSELIPSDKINIIGVLAVASNDCDECSVEVDFSIDKNGKKVNNAVDKYGNEIDTKEINGDTISILNEFREKIPIIVGIGDPGKMDKCDDIYIGAPITTAALNEIVKFKNNNLSK